VPSAANGARMHGFAAVFGHFREPASVKPAKNLRKSVPNPKKPKKTVEIRSFSIDFARLKAALF
jgi:hypothetical protein